MKVYYLSDSRIPSRDANSVHVMKIAAAMARLGHEVTVFARPGTECAPGGAHSYYGVDKCFSLQHCAWRPIRVVGGLSYALQVARTATRDRPDLFYGRHWASLAAVARFGVPTRFEVHAPPEGATQAFVIGRLISSGRLDRLVAISDALRTEYLRRFPALSPQRIVVARDAADPFPSDVQRATLPGRSGAFRAGYTGHLYPGKGMEIIAALAQHAPEVDFHVVGGTPGDVERWRIAAGPNVILHGHQPPARMPQLLASFDVLLAPYQRKVSVSGGRGDVSRWMSPLKLFEYMAAGKPILVSDLPVLREVVRDEMNGLLCSPDRIEPWLAALRRCMTQAEFARQLAARAREDFLAHYTWIERARRVLQ